jgi:hypothetical protein
MKHAVGKAVLPQSALGGHPVLGSAPESRPLDEANPVVDRERTGGQQAGWTTTDNENVEFNHAEVEKGSNATYNF